MRLHQHPVQRQQELFTPQLLLILGHRLGQGLVPQGSGGAHERGPLEFREESLDEAEVGFCRADFNDGVVEFERVVVFCAVFCEGEVSDGWEGWGGGGTY